MNLCQIVISEGWGGGETAVYELAKHLRDRGQKVSIILNQEILKYYEDLEGIALFDIGPLYNPVDLIKSIISPKIRPIKESRPRNRVLGLVYAYLDELLACAHRKRIRKKVLQFLSRNEIDVVHAHMPRAVGFAAELNSLGLPTVATLHGEHWLIGDMPVHPLSKPLTRWNRARLLKALQKMDKVTEVSEAMLDSYERHGVDLKGKSTCIHNGVDIQELRAAPQSKLKLKGNFNLLFPGGGKFIKGGDLLIKALAMVRQAIPGIHLYIALDVPEGHLLRKLVMQERLENDVTFQGFMLPQDYRALLNSVDIFVLPSRREAFAISCLEAMTLGKPIIASNIGGIPEVVENGRNGILVEQDPAHIAEAMTAMTIIFRLEWYRSARNAFKAIRKRNRLSVVRPASTIIPPLLP